jgi:hypothetical protein
LTKPQADPYKPYSWFKGTVLVDGFKVSQVGLRKRGFFGSADDDRPGLNIDFDKFVPGQEFAGANRMTLSNNKEDPSLVHQTLAYRVFAAAGAPSLRCNFAQVWLNGRDLGIYTHLETVDHRFLRRHFGNTTGHLYELTFADFLPGWENSIEGKNHKSQDDRESIKKMIAALQSGELDRISQFVDVDAFLTFWATEVLIGHWDGYSGIQNNCFCYYDLKPGKFRFIPWGTDTSLRKRTDTGMLAFDAPFAVMAVGEIARRLYDQPVTRERYRQRLRELLVKAWNEKELLAEIDRMQKLVSHRVPTNQLASADLIKALDDTREFIRSRRASIEAHLGPIATPWNFPKRTKPYMETVGKISVAFSAIWTTNRPGAAPIPDDFPPGSGAEINLQFYGRNYNTTQAVSKVMPSEGASTNQQLSIRASVPGLRTPIRIEATIPTEAFAKGGQVIPASVNGAVLAGNFEESSLRYLGDFHGPTMTLEKSTLKEGAMVQGRITADLHSLPWEDFDLRGLNPANSETQK